MCAAARADTDGGGAPMKKEHLDPIDQALALHEQAKQYQVEYQLDDAERCCREALQLLEQIEGEQHPDVANVLNDLSSILDQRGNYREAANCARRSLAIMEEIGHLVEGSEGQLIHIQALTALGTAHRQLGEYSDAEVFLRAALERSERAFPEDAARICSALNNLAVLYKYTGKFDEAEDLYRRALELSIRAHGEISGFVATIYHNLGGLEHARGRFEEGE